MATGNDDQEQEEEYVAVLDEGDENSDGDDQDQDEDQNQNQDQLNADDDEEADEPADERVAGHGEDELTDEEKRAEAKTEKRRVRRKEKKERDKREISFLQTRNAELERQFSTHAQKVDKRLDDNEIDQIDQRITAANRTLKMADDVMAKAISDQNGDDFTEAQEYRDQARDALVELEAAKQTIATREPARVEQGAVNPIQEKFATSFLADHPWYDPNTGDVDSLIVFKLDQQLTAEQYDPLSPEYWDELRARTRKVLPDHFKGSGDDADDTEETQEREKPKARGKPRGGPKFQTGGRERSLKRNEVHISRERREAMEEAGVWDDKVLRNKYLKSYAKYDSDANS